MRYSKTKLTLEDEIQGIRWHIICKLGDLQVGSHLDGKWKMKTRNSSSGLAVLLIDP